MKLGRLQTNATLTPPSLETGTPNVVFIGEYGLSDINRAIVRLCSYLFEVIRNAKLHL